MCMFEGDETVNHFMNKGRKKACYEDVEWVIHNLKKNNNKIIVSNWRSPGYVVIFRMRLELTHVGLLV